MSKLEFTIRRSLILTKLYLIVILQGLYLKAENKYLKLVKSWLLLQIDFRTRYDTDFRIVLLAISILVWLFIQSLSLVSIYN